MEALTNLSKGEDVGGFEVRGFEGYGFRGYWSLQASVLNAVVLSYVPLLLPSLVYLTRSPIPRKVAGYAILIIGYSP